MQRNHIHRTQNNDFLTDTILDDDIFALDGDDHIDFGYDNFSDDEINAGAGNDFIYAGFGNDTIDGGSGSDRYIYELGHTKESVDFLAIAGARDLTAIAYEPDFS